MDALERLQKIDRSNEIDGWNIRLFFWSRDPRLLAITAAAILLLGVAAAWCVRGEELTARQPGAGDLQKELARPKPDAAKIIELLPTAESEMMSVTPLRFSASMLAR